MAETLYEGRPAHNATFYVPSAGIVRFAFSVGAAACVRARPLWVMARVQPGARLFLSAGEHVLTLRDPTPMTRVLPMPVVCR